MEKLYSLFSRNEFLGVLKGTSIVLRDHTWGSQDYILIFNHLLNWLQENQSELVIQQLKSAFMSILEDKATTNSIDGGLVSLHVVKNYCIMAADKNYWPLTKDDVKSMINHFPIKDDFAMRDLKAINRYLS